MSNLITPEAILSYPQLFEPKPNMQGTLEYSCTLVFESDSDLNELVEAAQKAGEERFGGKFKDLVAKGQARMPFKDGEENYGSGTTFIRVKSKAAPGLVDRYADASGKPRTISDPDELYPGARVRASLRPYAYDANGNKGVAFGLNNLQKLGDGQRIDGRKPATSEFEALESAAADMDGTSGDLDDLLN